jgi:hypothetical protein
LIHTKSDDNIIIVPIQLGGKYASGGDTFSYRCLLSKFQVTANNFTQSLAKFIKQPTKFCLEVSKLTDGTVAFDDNTNNEGATLDKDVSQVEESRKRKKSEGNDDAEVRAKKKKLSKESIEDMESQQEISDNYIGEFCIL